MGWSDKFDEPIELPGGKKLVTLKHAIDHLSKTVPKVEYQHPKVLVAAACLANAAEGRDWSCTRASRRYRPSSGTTRHPLLPIERKPIGASAN